jgi:hypothetical protein
MSFGRPICFTVATLALLTAVALGQSSVSPATKTFNGAEHPNLLAGKPSPPVMSTEPAYINGDCAPNDTACKQILGLSIRLSGMESQLKDLQARSSFVCKSPTVSTNGIGVTDNCVPYKCKTETGLCPSVCRSVDDCSPGFACDQNQTCVAR